MKKPNEAGSPIKLSDAKRLVEAFKPVRHALTGKILKKITQDDYNDPAFELKKSMDYHAVNVNAYLFDAHLVQRFFEGNEPAKYLMVFLAADDEGKPTVVLAGMNPVPGKKDEFVSLNITDPGTQHPPKFADMSFPDPEGLVGGQLVVKLK